MWPTPGRGGNSPRSGVADGVTRGARTSSGRCGVCGGERLGLGDAGDRSGVSPAVCTPAASPFGPLGCERGKRRVGGPAGITDPMLPPTRP
jgi:hypothetical protein